jgi:hypothetical protein
MAKQLQRSDSKNLHILLPGFMMLLKVSFSFGFWVDKKKPPALADGYI